MMWLNMSYSAASGHRQAIGELKSHEIDQWLSDRSLADVVNLLPQQADMSGHMKKIPINASQALTFVSTSRQLKRSVYKNKEIRDR